MYTGLISFAFKFEMRKPSEIGFIIYVLIMIFDSFFLNKCESRYIIYVAHADYSEGLLSYKIDV